LQLLSWQEDFVGLEGVEAMVAELAVSAADQLTFSGAGGVDDAGGA
jgi:hypothetical protein